MRSPALKDRSFSSCYGLQPGNRHSYVGRHTSQSQSARSITGPEDRGGAAGVVGVGIDSGVAAGVGAGGGATVRLNAAATDEKPDVTDAAGPVERAGGGGSP